MANDLQQFVVYALAQVRGQQSALSIVINLFIILIRLVHLIMTRNGLFSFLLISFVFT